MKILLFSTKDFNDGEYMRKHVKKFKKADFDITQEIFTPKGGVSYMAYFVEVNTIEELIKMARITKRSVIVNTSIEDDTPFIEIYDDHRES